MSAKQQPPEEQKRGTGRPPRDPSVFERLNVPVEQLVKAVLRPPKSRPKGR